MTIYCHVVFGSCEGHSISVRKLYSRKHKSLLVHGRLHSSYHKYTRPAIHENKLNKTANHKERGKIVIGRVEKWLLARVLTTPRAKVGF